MEKTLTPLKFNHEVLIPLEAMELITSADRYSNRIVTTPKTEIEYKELCEWAVELRQFKKNFKSKRDELRAPHRAKLEVIDSYTKPLLDELEVKYRTAVGANEWWEKEQAKRAAEAQERLNREAEEKRLKEEEAARREMEKAEKYREQGRKEMAEKAESRAASKITAAEMTVAPIVQTQTPKVKGFRRAPKRWKGKITDPKAFVRWAVEEKQYHLLMPNGTAWNGEAQRMQEEKKVPGGEIFLG